MRQCLRQPLHQQARLIFGTIRGKRESMMPTDGISLVGSRRHVSNRSVMRLVLTSGGLRRTLPLLCAHARTPKATAMIRTATTASAVVLPGCCSDGSGPRLDACPRCRRDGVGVVSRGWPHGECHRVGKVGVAYCRVSARCADERITALTRCLLSPFRSAVISRGRRTYSPPCTHGDRQEARQREAETKSFKERTRAGVERHLQDEPHHIERGYPECGLSN